MSENTSTKAAPVVCITVVPKPKHCTIDHEIHAYEAGLNLDRCFAWPRFGFVDPNSAFADQLRSDDRQRANDEALNIRRRVARFIGTQHGEIHLFIGPGVVLTTDPQSGTWATVPGAGYIQEISELATAIYVAPNSEDPRTAVSDAAFTALLPDGA